MLGSVWMPRAGANVFGSLVFRDMLGVIYRSPRASARKLEAAVVQI